MPTKKNKKKDILDKVKEILNKNKTRSVYALLVFVY